MKKCLAGSRGEGWVLAQFGLFALFLFAPSVGPTWPVEFAFRIAGGTAALAGIAVLGASAINLGCALTPFPRPLPSAHLVTGGAYRFVRHPLYFGALLAALGFALLSLSPLRLALSLVMALFFDRKADREEQWLSERYAGYEGYRADVKKLVPWIY